MATTRLRPRGRLPRVVSFRFAFALAALSLTLSGNAIAAAQQVDPALQGRMFQNSDGALYVYKDGAKYLVDLATLNDGDINAISDGQPVQRLDLLFAQSAGNGVPAPAPTETPAFDLKTALISLAEVPSGWKLVDPTSSIAACDGGRGCTGQFLACKNVVPPADGVADRQLVAFGPSTGNRGDVADEVVRFFPGAAKVYVDSLASAISDCPAYNAAKSLWDGPALGDQTIRWVGWGSINGDVDKSGAGITVRIGDIVTEVTTYKYGSGADRVILEHAAERATALLQAAMH